MLSMVQVSKDQRGVLTIALNRPDVRNAFNRAVVDDLAQVFNGQALEPDIRAIVLRGNGTHFCAGGDLQWMRESVELDQAKNFEETRTLAGVFARLNEFPKPVLGVVQGGAIGGGVGLVSICDIVLASSEAFFALSEVRLGLIPAVIGPFVVAKIGASQARALILGAERWSAQRAKEIGLIHEIVPSPADLQNASEKILENLLQGGPHALAQAKKLVRLLGPRHEDVLDVVARMLADIRVSEEGQEGVHAFLEKRKPRCQ